MLSEVMATDLRRVMASGQSFSASQVQLFLYQILHGMLPRGTLSLGVR